MENFRKSGQTVRQQEKLNIIKSVLRERSKIDKRKNLMIYQSQPEFIELSRLVGLNYFWGKTSKLA